MSEGSALLPVEAEPVGDREEPPQGRARDRHVELIRRPARWEWLAVGVVVWSLYLVACACPAYYQTGWALDGPPPDGHPVDGWRVLAFGWLLVLLYPPACFPWSANFLLLCGWVAYLRGRSHRALVYGTVAVAAGFTAFAMPGSEVQRLLLGYYLWQASLIAFAAAAFRRWWQDRSTGGAGQARFNAEPIAADVTMNVNPRHRDDGV